MVHGCTVYTERAETAAVSCVSSHASAVSTPLRWIFKTALWKASHSCRKQNASAGSLLESGEERYIKAIIISHQPAVVQELCESRWTSWAVRLNEPSGFRGRKELLNRASALVTTCP